MISNDGLLLERPHPSGIGGVQRIYRWGDGGLSIVNARMLHCYRFRWEAAVLKFDDGGDWDIDYSTPLTNDVVVFNDDYEANDFIARAKELFSAKQEK